MLRTPERGEGSGKRGASAILRSPLPAPLSLFGITLKFELQIDDTGTWRDGTNADSPKRNGFLFLLSREL
jgi:hypothetical protein